jgi:hypothetical protein
MNHPDDVIRGGLRALVPHLKEFVRQHLEKKYGPGFRQRLSRPGERPFSDTDPRALIKASLSEWESAFRGHAPIQVKQYLHLLRDVGNRHAHHDSINMDEVHHALVTMRLLAVAIGGDQASSQFDRLLPQRSLAGSETAVTRRAAPTPARVNMIDGALLREYMAAFYGYGSYGAKIWLVGKEEGAGVRPPRSPRGSALASPGGKRSWTTSGHFTNVRDSQRCTSGSNRRLLFNPLGERSLRYCCIRRG